MINLSVSACGALARDNAVLGPRAFAVGFRPVAGPSLTTSEGTGATAFEGAMRGRVTADKFWAQVDVRGPDECWPWKGKSFRPSGYGNTSWSGQSIAASRLSWVLTAKIMPPSHLFVCHKCHNPPCCNPNHLYLGTCSDNMRDAVSVKRQSSSRKTHCTRGHLLPEPIIKDGHVVRVCQQCRAERNRQLRARVKQKAENAAADAQCAAYWRKLEEMAQAVKQGDADERAVIAWIWDTLGVQLPTVTP